MTENTTEKTKKWDWLWNFIDNIKGDKVVWIVVLMLIMISVVAIFSSTPLLDDKKTRLDIIYDQILTVMIGLAIIWSIYKLDALKINSIKLFMNLSHLGFAATFILLAILTSHKDLGIIAAKEINQAWRILEVKGFQIHVFEFAKIAMVMYLAWACHSYKKDQEMISSGQESTKLKLSNSLAKTKYFKFMGKPFWKRVTYMYLPSAIVCVMVLMGSGSSGLFIGAILLATLMIGGIPLKEVAIGSAIALVMLASGYGIYTASDGKALKIFGRIPTMISRANAEYNTVKLSQTKIGSPDFYKERDAILQPYGAKIAVHEGGFLGKGSGNSTQKYIVTNIYGDYMFSFLLEEYGLLGGVLVIILYVSLLARGSQIARMCKKEFTKIAVGGLTLLITGQAFMHMYVNVDLIPMTGQTLPLVSHGAFAFMMFCIAFGIILTISKLTKAQMMQAEAAAKPLYERDVDDIQASIDIIEQIDNDEHGVLDDDI